MNETAIPARQGKKGTLTFLHFFFDAVITREMASVNEVDPCRAGKSLTQFKTTQNVDESGRAIFHEPHSLRKQKVLLVKFCKQNVQKSQVQPECRDLSVCSLLPELQVLKAI